MRKKCGGGGVNNPIQQSPSLFLFFFSILLFRFYLRRRGAAPARGQRQAVRRRQRTAVGGLRQLQTLDIRHTSVVRLPAAIIKLYKLQYIRGGTKVTLGEEGTSASLAAAETETQPKCRSTHALLSWLPDLCRGRHAGDPCSYCKEFGSNYSCITLGSIRHCECRLDFNPLSKNKNC